MRALTLSMALVGCSGGGKDDDTGADAATCDSIVTEPLGAVPADQWPAGLADRIPLYNGLGGRWEADSSCGDTVALKFTNRSQEELQVVTSPWTTTTLQCGCVTDPSFPDDTSFDVIALHDQFQFYVETFPDPALNARTIVTSGAMYASGAPLAFRACGVDDVDPILQSVYDQVTTVLRVDAGGVMSGTLVLVPVDGAVETCELTNFELIEAQ